MKQITLPIVNLSGKNVGSIDLDANVFGAKVSPSLLHQAIVSFLANRRAPIANTKGRGDVAGSNKKPWKQKGTGHARHGSTRSPIWRGGGVTFGPTSERNFSVRMPQKMRQAAMKAALSNKVTAEQFTVIDSIDSLDGKTKSWIKALTDLSKTDARALIVSSTWNDTVDRSIRNVPNQKYVSVDGLTTYDIMRFRDVIMTKDAVESITQRLAKGAAIAATTETIETPAKETV